MLAQNREELLHARCLAEVGRLRLGLNALGADGGQRLVDLRVVGAVVVDEDVGAAGRQFQRDGAADALRATSDQRDLAGQRRPHS